MSWLGAGDLHRVKFLNKRTKRQNRVADVSQEQETEDNFFRKSSNSLANPSLFLAVKQ